jgi:hypothetical protein
MTALLVAFPNSHPRPTLLWMTTRLRHPPSLPHANGRDAVRPTTRPRMSTNANAMRLSSLRHRATRRPARDVSRAARVRSDSPLCDRGHRSGPRVAHKAVYSQGRSQGAIGGVDSDVVEVRLAFHPTALPAPSFVSLVCPPADGTWHGVGGIVVFGRRLRFGGGRMQFGVGDSSGTGAAGGRGGERGGGGRERERKESVCRVSRGLLDCRACLAVCGG